MNCPYCNQEMSIGYIQCRDGVNWTSKKQLIASLSFFGKDSLSLANGASDNNTAVYAYKCAHCQKIIIDYSDDNE